MGSSHFGDLSLESGRSSGSSRRGKKSNSDKPKQPQRGLGVAQLEKIRLHNQMGNGYLPSSQLHGPFHSNLITQEESMTVELPFSSSSSSSSSKAASSSQFVHVHSNIPMGFGEMERRDLRFMNSQSSFISDSNNNTTWEDQQFVQPPATLPLLRDSMEDWVQKKRRHDRRDSTGSSSSQELDLDLKLSI